MWWHKVASYISCLSSCIRLYIPAVYNRSEQHNTLTQRSSSKWIEFQTDKVYQIKQFCWEIQQPCHGNLKPHTHTHTHTHTHITHTHTTHHTHTHALRVWPQPLVLHLQPWWAALAPQGAPHDEQPPWGGAHRGVYCRSCAQYYSGPWMGSQEVIVT